MKRPKPRRLSFQDPDGSRGCSVKLYKSATWKDIEKIKTDYKQIGWIETTRYPKVKK